MIKIEIKYSVKIIENRNKIHYKVCYYIYLINNVSIVYIIKCKADNCIINLNELICSFILTII